MTGINRKHWCPSDSFLGAFEISSINRRPSHKKVQKECLRTHVYICASTSWSSRGGRVQCSQVFELCLCVRGTFWGAPSSITVLEFISDLVTNRAAPCCYHSFHSAVVPMLFTHNSALAAWLTSTQCFSTIYSHHYKTVM